ncbi:hypothetical protein OQJ13_07395 [Legionella sp. PATHC035]|uniref:hypothetical protein n=1 Tax=Legionella sp. PATHC035 TaxID=2992040 RepID=UPI002243DC05|nr:hypothetical protein [Legionella sp. PATHC035]MCW8408793.1 hypothetical protein [Legionella sp. PATHC035]
MNILISQRSQKLIRKYWLASGAERDELPSITLSIDLNTLISWLKKEQPKHSNKSKTDQQKVEFILVSLRKELLHDLFAAMKGDDIKLPQEEKNESVTEKIKFALLTAAGILVAACQGFDGIVTMLGIFELSSSVILGAGFVFSILSVIVFCGFDLVKVSNALGVKLSEAYKLLDAYLSQLQMIKSIRKKIEGYDFSDSELSPSDLQQLEKIISMLQTRFKSLTEASKQFEQALHSDDMQMAKTLISGASAVLFLGGGFFAGQSVALFISSLFVNPIIHTFWPVIIFSTLVGIAAFSLYWYVERPGLNKLMSSWFGLNEEHVQKLCDQDLIIKETKKLANLEKKIINASRLADRLAQLGGPFCRSDNELTAERAVINIKASTNYYSFLKSPDLSPPISSEQENLDKTLCISI